MRALRPGAYLCRRCVDEDLGFHGMAYWRRDHQRPGVFMCSKHGLVLNHTKDSDAFLRSPVAFTGDEFTIDPDWASRVIDSDIVRRFHAICAECMVRTHSIDEVYAARAIRDRAKAMDLHSGRGRRTKQLLSSFVRDQLDEAWISATLPELLMQPADSPWAPIDAAALGRRCGISSVVYALILASLFESCDEAINAVLAKPSTQRRTYAPSTQSVVPEAKLRESYSDQRGRHASVARALGRPYSEVRDRLLAIGLPDLSRVRPNELVQLVSAMTSAHGVDQRMEVFARADRASLNVLQRALAPLMQILKKVNRSAHGRHRGPRAKPSSPPLPASVRSSAVA
jgi:hypothetical protein